MTKPHRAATRGYFCLILVLISSLLSSCGDPNSLQVEFTEPDDILIRLSRTQCYGSCPVYTVEVTSSGEVRFTGYRYVEALGLHIEKIPAEAVTALAKEISNSGFMEITQEEVDECPSFGTDSPTALLKVQIGSTKNTIKHYLGCFGKPVHTTLWQLGQRVDETLNTSIWIKGQPSS